mgnify:CR=1 FL=1
MPNGFAAMALPACITQRQHPDDDATLDALAELCQGKRSFAELEQACRDGGFIQHLLTRLGADAARQLDHIAATSGIHPSFQQSANARLHQTRACNFGCRRRDRLAIPQIQVGGQVRTFCAKHMPDGVDDL